MYVCLLQVPWSLISTLIFSILLVGYIKRKSYFSFVNDSAIEQINLKKEPWTACALVCQPVVVDRGPFRDLPRKLHCHQEREACWAEGKLHTQPHAERVR